MPLKGKRHVTRSKKYTKGTARTNPGFRKKVLSVIKRQQEIKINVQSQDSQAIELFNLGVANMSYLDLAQFVIAPITQAADNVSRIGAKINIRSWVIKGNLIMNNYSGTQQPAYIKAIVLKSKTNKDYASEYFDDLFERPPPAMRPGNTLSDVYSPIDKDNYTVYAQRVFKLGPSTGSHPNNDFQVSRMFSINLTKHFKKFEWKDDGSGVPSSPSNLYMIFVGCYADNTAITFGPYTGPQVIYSWTSCVRFTDD